jgi:hypothetical protein
LRTRMGMRARAQAALHTYQSHWRLWETTYADVLASPPRRSGDRSERAPGLVGARRAS